MASNRIELIIDGNNITAIRAIDGVETKLNSLKSKSNDTNTSIAQLTAGLKSAAGILGMAWGTGQLINFAKEAITTSAELEVLRNNFKGTKEDIELFRKATAGTVSEANLLKLSNQADDLGITIQDQAKFFFLAEEASDKYGTSLEESFQKVVLATEGQAKGLKALGIQKATYNEIVDKLAKAEGNVIEKLDAETQKQIRIQAVLQATGVTIQDVNNQLADSKDRLEQLGVAWEETKTSFGEVLRKGTYELMYLIGAVASGEGIYKALEMQKKEAEKLHEQFLIKDYSRKATVDAADEIKNKTKTELKELYDYQKNLVESMKGQGSSPFDLQTEADKKISLAAEEAKLKVYESQVSKVKELTTEQKKLAAEEAKLKESMVLQSSLFGLDEMQIGLFNIEKKYFDLRNKIKSKPLLDLLDENETIEKLQFLLSKASTSVVSLGTRIKQQAKNALSGNNNAVNFLPTDDQLNARVDSAKKAIESISTAEMLNYIVMQGYAEQAFGNMSDAMMSFYEAGGERSRAFFDMYKEFAVAETIISTYKAASNALEAPPVGLGPVWGWALAATVIASGLARVAQIASTQPGSTGGGSTGGGSMSTSVASVSNNYAGNSSTTKNSQSNLTINLHGITDIGKWLRDNKSDIQKFFNDGNIVINNN